MEHSASLHVLPDGASVAAISSYPDSTVVWDIKTGRLQRHLKTYWGYGTVSNDGRWLATSDAHFHMDPPIRLYDLKERKEARSWPGHRCGQFVFSPNGSILTTYGGDFTLRRWEVATGKEIGIAAGHQNRVTGVCFTRNGEQIVSCSEDGTARFWNAADGKELRRLTAEGERFRSLDASPDGKLLAFVSAPVPTSWRFEEFPKDSHLRLWNVPDEKECLRNYLADRAVHEIRFLPARREFISIDSKQVCFHRIADGKVVRTIADRKISLQSAIGSPDGKLLITNCRIFFSAGGPEGEFVCWNTDTLKEIFSRRHCSVDGISSLAFSPDGKSIAVAGGVSDEGLHNRGLSLLVVPGNSNIRQFENARTDVDQVVFSPDGRLLAASDSAGGITVFETATRRQRWRFIGHIGKINRLAFSDDSRRLVSGGEDTLIYVWDVTGLHGRKLAPLDPRDLDAAWAALAELDGEKAGNAIALLAAQPEPALPHLRRQLGILSKDDVSRIDKLIQELDNDQFSERDRAAKELERFSEAAMPALRRAVIVSRSEEVRNTSERLLRKLGPGDDPATSALACRALRVVEVLERIGTEPARELLRHIVERGSVAPQREAAALAIKRLGK